MGASPRGKSQGNKAGPSKASVWKRRWRLDDGTGFTCPICLLEFRELALKAVTVPCHHDFCLVCLLKWADIKKNCPVCKCVLEGYIFHIKSDARFEQYSFPAEKKREGVDVTFIETRDAQQRRNPHPGGLQYPCNFSRRYNTRVPCVRSEAVRSVNKMRDASLRKRVTVYAKGLRAVSSGAEHPSQYRPETPEEVERLEGWIHREIRALLGVKDTKTLVSYVMRVVRRYGFAGPMTGKKAQYTKTFTGQPSRQRVIVFDAISALHPILQTRAALFWHELKAFAISRLSMRRYDRVVHYSGELKGSEDTNPSVHPDDSKGPHRRESSTDDVQSRPRAEDDVGLCGDARAATSRCDSPLFGIPSKYCMFRFECSGLDEEDLSTDDEVNQGEERQQALFEYSGPGSRSEKLPLGKRRHPNEAFEVGDWRPYRKGLQGGPGVDSKRGRSHVNESLHKRARTGIRSAEKGPYHGVYCSKSPKWGLEGPSHKGIHHRTDDVKSPRWGPDGLSRSKGLFDELFEPKSPKRTLDSPSHMRLDLDFTSAGVTSGWQEHESPQGSACNDVENTKTRVVPRAKFGDSQEDKIEHPSREPGSPGSPFGGW